MNAIPILRYRTVLTEAARFDTFTIQQVWQAAARRTGNYYLERGWSYGQVKRILDQFVAEGLARMVQVGAPGRARIYGWVETEAMAA